MKEHIHTIPVMDAFKDSLASDAHTPGTCPFCLMRERLEHDAVDFMMSPAYMEDDIRMETNAAGFCPAHLEKMYNQQNRLGLALMLHTHFKQLNKDMEGIKKNLGVHLEKTVAACYLCAKVDGTFTRYVETFFKLWLDGGEEARVIEAFSGYCLPHFALILHEAEKMGKAKMTRFKEMFLPNQLAYMKRMEEDLEWFTMKFDYRYFNEPWKNAKDALPRAIGILTGGNYAKDKELL